MGSYKDLSMLLKINAGESKVVVFEKGNYLIVKLIEVSGTEGSGPFQIP